MTIDAKTTVTRTDPKTTEDVETATEVETTVTGAALETAAGAETTVAGAALETATDVETTVAGVALENATVVKSTAAATAKEQIRRKQAMNPRRRALQLKRATRQRKKKRRSSGIRKTKKKPIRGFFEEGINDLDNSHGNWPLGNMAMEAALKFKGYDYKYVWGHHGHSGKHMGTLFPDALRWLWRK